MIVKRLFVFEETEKKHEKYTGNKQSFSMDRDDQHGHYADPLWPYNCGKAV